MFTERELRRGLKTQVLGQKIYTFETIDSTNNCAKTVANVDAPEGVIVIAEEQTAGRGRLGRTWQANAGENLTFSVLLRPKAASEAMNLLPLFAAVATAEAIASVTNLNVECKWPNDLLIGKKKVGGILIEGSVKSGTLEYVVLGFGINVNQVQFSADLKEKATSLKLESNQEIDRAKLFKEIVRTLEEKYKTTVKTGFQSVIPSWLEHSRIINQPIALSQQGNVIMGIVSGLSKDGGLVLQTNGSKQTFYAGDVTVLTENTKTSQQHHFSASNIATPFPNAAGT